MIDEFLAQNRRSKGKNLFRISQKKQKEAFDTLRPVIADNALNAQQQFIRRNLKKKALQNREVSLAIDPTVKKYCGFKANHCQPTGYVGQRETYAKAFSEYSVYDSTSQFLMNSQPKYATGSHYKRKALPHWISQLKSQISRLESQKVQIKAIYGDREFYQGIAFAYATLGKFSPPSSPYAPPRLCIPKKMYNSIETKWAFLLNTNRHEVEVDEIELNYYHTGLLGSSLHYFPTNSTKTRYKIPYYSVATFDAYSNRKKKQTLSWAKLKARRLANMIQDLTKRLKKAKVDYLKFRKALFPNRKDVKIPNFKGKRHQRFKYIGEKPLYLQCRGIYLQLKRYESNKINICKRLMIYVKIYLI